MKGLSQREKYPSVLNLKINYKVTTKFLFLKGNINKTLEGRKHGVHNQFWVRESVMTGEGISTPHIVVLNGNSLVSFVLGDSLKRFKLVSCLKILQKMNKTTKNKLFIKVLDETFNLAHMYPLVQRGIQSYVNLSRKFLLVS